MNMVGSMLFPGLTALPFPTICVYKQYISQESTNTSEKLGHVPAQEIYYEHHPAGSLSCFRPNNDAKSATRKSDNTFHVTLH